MKFAYLSTVFHVRKDGQPPTKWVTIDEAWEEITSDRHRAAVEAIRAIDGSTPDGKLRRKRLKETTLPAIQVFEGESGPLPLMFIDFENEDHALLEPFKESIFCKFESPSGGGRLAVGIALPPEYCTTKESRTAYAKKVEAYLGFASSSGQASSDRPRFLSWDPKASLNPEAAGFYIPAQDLTFIEPLKIDNNTGRENFRLFRMNHSLEDSINFILRCDRSGSTSLGTDQGARAECLRFERQHHERRKTTEDEPLFLGDTITDPDQDDSFFVNLDAVYPAPVPIVAAPCGRPILFLNSVTTLAGGSKAGKSFVMFDMLATCAGAPSTMGLKQILTEPLNAIYFDMELGKHRLQASLRRANSPLIKVAALRSLKPLAALEFVTRQISLHRPKVIVIDTAADLVTSPNEEGETIALATYLMALADAGCAVLVSIHFNPGSGTKTRGHLGSHLERKTDMQLSATKDPKEDDVKKIACYHSRVASPKPFFIRYRDDLGTFVLDDTISLKKADGKRMDAITAVCAEGRVFASVADMARAIQEISDASDKTARNWVDWGLEVGRIVRDGQTLKLA